MKRSGIEESLLVESEKQRFLSAVDPRAKPELA